MMRHLLYHVIVWLVAALHHFGSEIAAWLKPSSCTALQSKQDKAYMAGEHRFCKSLVSALSSLHLHGRLCQTRRHTLSAEATVEMDMFALLWVLLGSGATAEMHTFALLWVLLDLAREASDQRQLHKESIPWPRL